LGPLDLNHSNLTDFMTLSSLDRRNATRCASFVGWVNSLRSVLSNKQLATSPHCIHSTPPPPTFSLSPCHHHLITQTSLMPPVFYSNQGEKNTHLARKHHLSSLSLPTNIYVYISNPYIYCTFVELGRSHSNRILNILMLLRDVTLSIGLRS
jgi:hypothetical protein